MWEKYAAELLGNRLFLIYKWLWWPLRYGKDIKLQCTEDDRISTNIPDDCYYWPYLLTRTTRNQAFYTLKIRHFLAKTKQTQGEKKLNKLPIFLLFFFLLFSQRRGHSIIIVYLKLDKRILRLTFLSMSQYVLMYERPILYFVSKKKF